MLQYNFPFVLSNIFRTSYYNNNLALSQSFSALAQLTFHAGQFLGVGGCRVPWRRCCGIPGPYSVDISSTPLPAVTTKNVPRPCQMSPGESKQNHSLVGDHCFNSDTNFVHFLKNYFPLCFSELSSYLWVFFLSLTLKAA